MGLWEELAWFLNSRNAKVEEIWKLRLFISYFVHWVLLLTPKHTESHLRSCGIQQDMEDADRRVQGQIKLVSKHIKAKECSSLSDSSVTFFTRTKVSAVTLGVLPLVIRLWAVGEWKCPPSPPPSLLQLLGVRTTAFTQWSCFLNHFPIWAIGISYT